MGGGVGRRNVATVSRGRQKGTLPTPGASTSSLCRYETGTQFSCFRVLWKPARGVILDKCALSSL